MNIRVYTGTGTSRNGAPLLVEELSKHLDQPVAGIDEHELRNSSWEKETSTLIFAGQSVGLFKQALGEDVMQRIKQGVACGAFDYIGICAGVAFASNRIKYRMRVTKPSDLPRIENTGLSLFNGLATGPCKSVSPLPFSGGIENLALIRLRTNDFKEYNALFWGGPAIIPMETINPKDGGLIACLQNDGTPMALRTKFGQGNVSLFSFHPEINADNILRWAGGEQNLQHTVVLNLQALAQKLDGTAFPRFLRDAGLKSGPRTEKEAAFTTPSLDF